MKNQSKEELLAELSKIAKLSNGSKFARLFFSPFRYLKATLFKTFVFPFTKKTWQVAAQTFFGATMQVEIPAGIDIYLLKTKTHSSEIRLAKFLMLNLSAGQHFLDIGTHFGFFSLLASHLVEKNGKVLGIEASPSTFRTYKKNIKDYANIIGLNKAASNQVKTIVFYEFSSSHSEYNTTNKEQFENEPWFKNHPPKKIEIEAFAADNLLAINKMQPNIIKIDVEGAEYEVLQGLIETLNTSSPFVSVEFLPKYFDSVSHQKALILLKELGYTLHFINEDGSLNELDFMELKNYFILNNIDSENFIFAKKN